VQAVFNANVRKMWDTEIRNITVERSEFKQIVKWKVIHAPIL